jgi:hypothetical protein
MVNFRGRPSLGRSARASLKYSSVLCQQMGLLTPQYLLPFVPRRFDAVQDLYFDRSMLTMRSHVS